MKEKIFFHEFNKNTYLQRPRKSLVEWKKFPVQDADMLFKVYELNITNSNKVADETHDGPIFTEEYRTEVQDFICLRYDMEKIEPFNKYLEIYMSVDHKLIAIGMADKRRQLEIGKYNAGYEEEEHYGDIREPDPEIEELDEDEEVAVGTTAIKRPIIKDNKINILDITANEESDDNEHYGDIIEDDPEEIILPDAEDTDPYQIEWFYCTIHDTTIPIGTPLHAEYGTKDNSAEDMYPCYLFANNANEPGFALIIEHYRDNKFRIVLDVEAVYTIQLDEILPYPTLEEDYATARAELLEGRTPYGYED